MNHRRGIGAPFRSVVRTLGAALLVLSLTGAAAAQLITEFPSDLAGFSWYPNDIAVASDGSLWFSQGWPQPPRIVRMTTAGSITGFPLSNTLPAGIQGLTVGPDGNIWFTEITFAGLRVARLTPGGNLTEFPVSGIGGITPGPDGNLWLAEEDSNRIGKISIEGALTEFSLPITDSRPTAITKGPDGNLWFIEQGATKVGRMTVHGELLAEYPIEGDLQMIGITAGPDGNLWITGNPPPCGAGRILRLTQGGTVTAFPIPQPDTIPDPYIFGNRLGRITAGLDGSLWFTQGGADHSIEPTVCGYSPSRIGRITTQGFITSFSIPLGFTPFGITAGLDGNIWFTERGRMIGSLEPPPPTLLWLAGARFKVQVSWRAPTGPSGEGQALPLTSSTGGFWFFDPDNLELVVKILDGRAINGRWWVFYGALSNVEYTITVTDAQTGAVKTYFNPQGQLASVADTGAF